MEYGRECEKLISCAVQLWVYDMPQGAYDVKKIVVWVRVSGNKGYHEGM